MLFPLITFPYSSRILEAEGIGIVNFYQSIISYISLVTCLGIPLYATREIAKVRHDLSQLSKVTTEILWLHILLTIIGYIVVGILCFTVKQISENKDLFLILSSSIFFTTIGCEWFYRGTEDFKFITIRGITIRLIYLPLLFIFVRTKSDLIAYGLLTVFVSVGNNIFNIYRLSKKVCLKDFKYAIHQPQKHIRGVLRIFALTAAISLYTQLNIAILGFMSTVESVGYYVAATKITTIVSGVISALQTTLLPRSSSLLATSDMEGFQNTIRKVLNFIFCFGIPLSCGIFIMADPIISILCGESYLPAITTLKIISPTLFIIALSAVVSGGILLPQGKEKIATIACIIGGIVNIISNVILIPYLSQNGTAIASVATEISVTLSMIVFGREFIPVRIWNNGYIKYLFSTMIMIIVCITLFKVLDNIYMLLGFVPLIGMGVYCVSLIILRDRFIMDILHQLRLKIIK